MKANEDLLHSKFVEDWNPQMSESYQKALQNWSHGKEAIKRLSAVPE